MTNFEWLMKEKTELVKECMVSAESVAVDSNGCVDECGNITCNNCIFGKLQPCSKEQKEWLNAEHNPYTIPLNTPIDTKVLVSQYGRHWVRRYFAGFSEIAEEPYLTFRGGTTSWTNEDSETMAWEYCKLAEGEEQK